MITRYTTPYHYFILPIKRDLIQTVYITYSQNGTVLFEKSSANGQIDLIGASEVNNAEISIEEELIQSTSTDTFAIIHLSQEDTFQFQHYPAEEKNITLIQVRVISTDGGSYVSRVIRDRIYGTLKEEVIDG